MSAMMWETGSLQFLAPALKMSSGLKKDWRKFMYGNRQEAGALQPGNGFPQVERERH